VDGSGFGLFKYYPGNWMGKTEEIMKNLPGKPVSEPRFKLATFRIRSRTATHLIAKFSNNCYMMQLMKCKKEERWEVHGTP
jgi:hypothetical protein